MEERMMTNEQFRAILELIVEVIESADSLEDASGKIRRVMKRYLEKELVNDDL
jgi:hypothetical protein